MIQSIHSQRGTTLVEVLIAAVIVGIGLLGIASLQVKALQASTDAEYRAKATDIAWALADRMRANLASNTSNGNHYISTTALASNYLSSPDRSWVFFLNNSGCFLCQSLSA
ncbi:type IV pilus modification protein PilV [Thiolapillus sp.]|uniref:type IV pilus modification protein PilV n=2 Tax=Thiolapillus sp. TaxID=2017437 RepID=UPI003AF420BC